LLQCNEKIAYTFTDEAITSKEQRKFEYHMSLAFQEYAASSIEATADEKDGLLIEENGGSSHGSMEVLYRLHASRLKCLIAAVDRFEDTIDDFEVEALRLTECHWFVEPVEKPESIRSRVWNVLTDVVSALVHCRNKYSCFHRSVYRHAQALMWSHVLNNPKGDRRLEVLGALPAARACRLRGMNSDDVAESAFVIINSLFERRRSQLVAVWVSNNGGGSPFQVLNSSVRKFDSLRGKYIAAYLESLKLCNKREEVEAFLRSAIASSRDEPSYFASSAEAQGGNPKTNHVEDCLLIPSYRSLPPFFFLTSVKRQANGVLASLVLKEMVDKGSEKLSQPQVSTETFKEAFSCFRRLKCSVDDLVNCSAWRYEHSGRCLAADVANRSIKAVVDAVTAAYGGSKYATASKSSTDSDWGGDSQGASLLREALVKGGEVFPNLSATFYSKKHNSPKRKRKGASRDAPNEARGSAKSYEVAVPAGLSAGSTFVVSIEQDGRPRKVRLTVPAQAVQLMRFTLPAAASGDGGTDK
jgi:hypothetical protein